MNNLSRRAFGKTVAGGVVGGLAIASVPPLSGQAGSSVKRMTTVLRELIGSPGIIAAPGVYDPLTARIAELTGFQCLDMPGNAFGVASCIAEPALSLEDVAQATRRITAAINIPLVADAGAGYGEPAHVTHTIRVLEQAGAAGMHMEDQIYPKRFHYHAGMEHVIAAEAMIDKIHMAVEGRRDPDFVIIARTDAVKTDGFAEAVRRANLYLKAGADVIMMFPETLDDLKRAPKEVPGPLNYNISTKLTINGDGLSLQELGALGYKILNFAHVPEFASYKAVRDSLAQLKKTGTVKLGPEFIPIAEEIEKVVGLPNYYRIENETTEKT
jgi:2-methylisocitrate lyase-like PEP mutase family enzyme